MTQRRALLVMFMAFVSASPCASAQVPSNQYTQVLQYTLEVVDTRRIMYGIIDRDKLSDATKQAMRQAVANIDLGELAVKMTAGYEAKVTTQQVDQCMSFIKSPVGQKTLAAAHKGSLQSNSQAFIDGLNSEDRSHFNAYMSGPCVFANLPDTQEMHEAFFTFFHEQTCMSLSKTNPNAYLKLEQANYCKP